MALPSCSPGNQVSGPPFTGDSQGIATGPPVWSTTTVRGFAFATAATSACWSGPPVGAQPNSVHAALLGSRLLRSAPSLLLSPTKTMAVSAAVAAATASAVLDPSAYVTRSPAAAARV